jgi:hypothetical protein
MLDRLKQYISQNDKDYIFYKNFYDIFIELIYFDYPKMLFTGSDNDILDLNKASMFCRNDPIEIIVRYTRTSNMKPLSHVENMLLDNAKNLIEKEIIEKQSLNISLFSGLSHARDSDWGTLENYGKSLSSYEENIYKLIDELFNSGKIKTAIHHTWSDRYYYCNNNFSHRLAALYIQDTVQNKKTRIDLELDERKLNIDCGKFLYDNYIGIITTGKTYLFLSEQLKKSNAKILLEYFQPIDKDLCILWIEKSQDKIVSNIVKFISCLPSDRCYIISNILKNYL